MEELILSLKEQIIQQLNLLDKKPEDIDNDAPIFGDGLGLDSIDALEIIVLLERNYGIQVENADQLRPHFQSIRTLAEYIHENRKIPVS
jgi:acyl carrier protein